MKTKIKYVFISAFFTVALASCFGKKASKNVFSCSTASQKYADAFTNYSVNQTEGNCEKIKDALKELVNKCDYGNSVTKEDKEEIESLDCSGSNS
ncbi:hypothetical protein LAG90_10930 [Marinilongibacter aquaticus]|uniref:hypothetical protein n=1 Tax=Marinilongibacter aquaticus TaxID=2975157 RepID=UPI0021BD1767|nr:hypothetical protein [Marinilongibacter aquaticus]UBM57333.1 hypothetical protein LAG90_10930 [Marinilongibacter aquaticus]